ncbi:hypothetical protein [Flavobacterium capsici]|uniref:Uncharacterized protein n=1 Tax=Flavobacterium capsici TaxID=3075618 RepID=A0AA96EXD5_9FLAO|nr:MULTISPECIES: hypothetical protein [unclassified Flavobacterium]WNM20358.1 hypothetical protein RN608_06675 [Flavobacterium sp. PMR2A8]WNM21748.1 hypothetical protein RN605_13845 [Flavobacterium sp. PMTSA4]
MIKNIKNKIPYIKIVLIIISFYMLVMSLFHNAFYIGKPEAPEEVASLYAFLFGWISILFITGIPWLANLFLFFSWLLLLFKSNLSLYSSILAVLFSLSFLLFETVVTNEGGVSRKIIGYGTGYWLWLSTCIVNCIGIFIIKVIDNKINRAKSPDFE